jgi:hypothetical protein
LVINIPGGKPDRVIFHDGTTEGWAGGENYPTGVLIMDVIDLDKVTGRVLSDEPRQVAAHDEVA